jgi:hypothetical protein
MLISKSIRKTTVDTKILKLFSSFLNLNTSPPLTPNLSRLSLSSFSNNLQISKNLITQLEKIKGENLSTSPIRLLDVGKNYFKHVNTRRKKILMTLLNSYIKQFKDESEYSELKKALDLFYLEGKSSIDLESEADLSECLLWHLNMIMIMERMASQYSRYEFMEYDKIINNLNSITPTKRNKAKFVFTSHPTQPNSIEQLKCFAEIFKAIEENDLHYLDQNMLLLINANKNRVFKKPTYIEESIAFHSICIPNLINSISMLYELGLKEPGDFFEIPGTWMTFDFDNHPEMSVGIMTYTHGLCLNITCDIYLKLISEAFIEQELHEVKSLLVKVKDYADKLIEVSSEYKKRKISKNEFYEKIPIINLYGIEANICKLLTEFSNQASIVNDSKNEINTNTNNTYTNNSSKSTSTSTSDLKVIETSKKILKIFQIFKLTGCMGQIRLAGEDLLPGISNPSLLKEIIHDILKEISILNSNGKAAEMIIIANYEYMKQYDLIKELMQKYHIQNLEIVPLLETFSSSNDTDSKITMIASSDTRQRDGLLLTELRVLREYKKNPDKYIYMGQGITAERGGGPYNLVHQKLISLTRVQRERHIRTVQGHQLLSEFVSKDLVFSFLLNIAENLHMQSFEPTQDYMDFLFELDNVVGVPQREMQRSKEFNDFYVKNNIIKVLCESFNYAGSREMSKPLENVKKQRAIVQAYINSDRCSFTHPELAYWDRLDESLIRNMSKFYYDNNPHFKLILYNYAFMCKRFDLDFAREEVGFKEDNSVYRRYVKGKKALEEILNHLGLGPDSDPMMAIWNQHLGLVSHSSYNESLSKFEAFRFLYLLQNHYVRKYVKDKNIGVDAEPSLRKLRILQSALANISPFNGKG